MSGSGLQRWLDEQVANLGVIKFAGVLVLALGAVYQITQVLETPSVAAAVIASLVGCQTLLLAWVFHGRAVSCCEQLSQAKLANAAEREELAHDLQETQEQWTEKLETLRVNHDQTVAALTARHDQIVRDLIRSLGFVVSTAGSCCYDDLEVDAPPSHQDVRARDGFRVFEEQVVESIAALLPPSDRRFSLFYGKHDRLVPGPKQGWPDPPPVLSIQPQVESNEIDAKDSFLRDCLHHTRRLIPDVLNAAEIDQEFARCITRHFDGDRYRCVGWYPICIYGDRPRARRGDGVVVGGILVQCVHVDDLQSHIHGALGLLANILGAGYAAASMKI